MLELVSQVLFEIFLGILGKGFGKTSLEESIFLLEGFLAVVFLNLSEEGPELGLRFLLRSLGLLDLGLSSANVFPD